MDGNYTWKECSEGSVPIEAVEIFPKDEIEPEPSYYVGRVRYQDHQDDILLPAKVILSEGAIASWNGSVHHFLKYDVLCNASVAWARCSRNTTIFPQNAIPVDHTAKNFLYVGRARYANIARLGKVHPEDRVLYFPFEEQELHTEEYEVMIQNIL